MIDFESLVPDMWINKEAKGLAIKQEIKVFLCRASLAVKIPKMVVIDLYSIISVHRSNYSQSLKPSSTVKLNYTKKDSVFVIR